MSQTLNKIKALLGMHDEVSLMAEAKLVDGTAIGTDAEAFEDGVLVFVLGEDGEKMPLPSGAYELEGGIVIEVVDGEIVSKKEAESSEAVEEEMSSEEEVVEEEKQEVDLSAYALKSDIASSMELMMEEISGLKEQIAELSAVKEELSNTKEELSKVSKLSAEKSFKHTPKTNAKVEEVNMSSMNSDERIFAIFNKNKN